MGLLRHLIAILGRRSFLTYGVVTLLVASILAAVNVTSRYALKVYVDDQLARTPWDMAVYQRGAQGVVSERRARLAAVPGMERVEVLAFLRAQFQQEGAIHAEAGGARLATPWLSILAATDPEILPPEVRGADAGGAVLALVGPERAMGKAFLALQGVEDFSLHVTLEGQQQTLFRTPLRAVVRLDRDELNRWLVDQTGSVSYIPYVGVILLMPFDAETLNRFDAVANGLIPTEMLDEDDTEYGHVPSAEYHPEIAYLGRIARHTLISGWDIDGSLIHVKALNRRIGAVSARFADLEAADRSERRTASAAQRGALVPASFAQAPAEAEPDPEPEAEPADGSPELINAFAVDSTTEVLLERMQGIARLVGVVSLLIALPMLWMSWVLAANLSGLLMLNERRTLGLLRLRGVPGRLLGRALLVSILAGGVAGGVLGVIAGTLGPLAIYEGGRLPLEAIVDPRQIAYLASYLAVSLLLGLLVGRRLVRYAMTISPLEAARRITHLDVARAGLRFGPLQALSLLAGFYTLVVAWSFGWRLSAAVSAPWARWLDWGLDFMGLPLFLYGAATMLASTRGLIQRAGAPLIRPVAGVLGPFAIRHTAVKRHRAAAFLLMVALMTSVSIYPTVTSRSFADKAERGAMVQLGSDWQLLFNSPDLVDVSQLRGELGLQIPALQPRVERLVEVLRGVPGVRDASVVYEAILPTFYLPGYGLRGVPLYLLADADAYLAHVYSEPQVGLSAPFEDVAHSLDEDRIAASASVADFWELRPGSPVMIGVDGRRFGVSATTGGVIAYLPGIPPRSVNDRQGYVQARIDYLNHLFNSNSYLAGAVGSPGLEHLEVLIPRVIVLVGTAPGADTESMRRALLSSLPIRPLEVHALSEEIAKLGTDMYIALALANMRIYLAGGLVLAVVGILAIAMVNYREDRRTFALLRIRGASPAQLRRFFLATLLSPGVLGLLVGAVAALVAGYGLANYVWTMREIRTVVQLLPTRLAISGLTLLVPALLVLLLASVTAGFSWWVYKRTVQQTMQEG